MRISKAKAARPLLMAHQPIGELREIFTNVVSHHERERKGSKHGGSLLGAEALELGNHMQTVGTCKSYFTKEENLNGYCAINNARRIL